MIELLKTKSNSVTACVGGKFYHSRYDPRREADKFLKQHITTPPRQVVLIGAGLGYLGEALNHLYPHCRIIPIWLDKTLYLNSKNFSSLSGWYPGKEEDLDSYINEHITEANLIGTQVLLWPLAESLFPRHTERILVALNSRIKQLNSDLSTQQHFGYTWFKNSLRNFYFIPTLSFAREQEDFPYVIAASGPSLEGDLPWIKKNQDKVRVLALPSALGMLNHAGIIPDYVITQDSGYWANYHLRQMPKDTRLICPLSASSLAGRLDPEPLVYTNRIWYEEYLTRGFPITTIPQAGSVLFSALYMAQALTRGPLVLAGVDFYQEDIKTHGKPHSFDHWFQSRQNRWHPELEIRYKRMLDFGAKPVKEHYRSVNALGYYRHWFEKMNKGRLYQLSPHRLGFYELPLFRGESGPLKGALPLNQFDLPPQNEKKAVIQKFQNDLTPKTEIEFKKLLCEFYPLDFYQLEGFSPSVKNEKEKQLREKLLSALKKSFPYQEDTNE